MKLDQQFRKIQKTGLPSLFAYIALSAFCLLTACGGKKGSGVNPNNANTADANSPSNSNDKTNAQPQNLELSTNEYEQLPEEKKNEYEAPPKEFKVKNIIVKNGQSKFSDITYTGDTENIKVTGRFKLTDVEDISNDDVFSFELRGKIKEGERIVYIKAYDVDKRDKNRVRLGAVVGCLKYDDQNKVDCSEAVVDFYIQVKQTNLRSQFKTARKEKPKDKTPKPEPTPPVASGDEPPKDPVKPEPVNPNDPQPPKPNDAKDTAGHAEGADGSLKGAFNTHVTIEDDLDEIFPDDKKPSDPAEPPVPKKEKPKVTKDGLTMTSEGILRPVHQAYDYPDDGHLVQATDLVLQQRQLREDRLYTIVHPDRKKHFATYEMGQLISKLGQFASQKYSKPFAVGNLSLMKGGESPPHASHQNGTDGDFGYLTDDPDVWFPSVAKGGRLYSNAYSADRTLEVLERAFKTTDVQVDRIFMDQLIIDDLCKVAKRKGLFDPGSSDPKWAEKNEFWKNVFRNIQHVDGHGDHMHIRIKCTPQQRFCLQKIYRKVNNCQD